MQSQKPEKSAVAQELDHSCGFPANETTGMACDWADHAMFNMLFLFMPNQNMLIDRTAKLICVYIMNCGDHIF